MRSQASTRGAAIVLAAAIPLTAHAAGPWRALENLRAELSAAGPLVADFVQTYVPGGFSTGEKENGRLAFSLPSCLRWDYATPYEKSFLLCGEEVHYWNKGESQGRRYRVRPTEEPGLDLLLLTTDHLSLRYNATADSNASGWLEVTLQPAQSGGQVMEATLVIDTEGQRLRGLSYRDVEGNLTRFEISGYRRLDDASIFTPPADMVWESDQP